MFLFQLLTLVLILERFDIQHMQLHSLYTFLQHSGIQWYMRL